MGKNVDQEKIEAILFQFNKVLGNIPIYGDSGPQYDQACNEIATAINDYCFLNGEFSIGEMGDKLSINDAIVECL